jgi:hypothetical protein
LTHSERDKYTNTSENFSTRKETRFKHQFDLKYNGSKGHPNTEPSLTVPDQNTSIQQLLIAHSRGLPLNVQEKEGHYFGSPIPNFTDLLDRAEYAEELKQEAARLQQLAETELAELELQKASKASHSSPDERQRQDGTTVLPSKIPAP